MNFDQADVQSLKLRPTLIVGLGDAGGAVLQRLRSKLVSQFGAEVDIPSLALLWLDDQAGSGPAQSGLSRLSLGLEDPSKVVRRLSGPGYSHVNRWWYPGWSSLGELSTGLMDSRPGGRMRFFYHFAALRQVLLESLTRLRDPENSTRLLNSPDLRRRGMVAQVQFDQATQVQVICASGEGCSGMLIDLGFLLRDLVPDAAVTRNCWVALEDPSSARFKANSYALLKELNHYSFDQHGFTAEWEPGRNVRPNWPVYDSCWLQSGPSEEVRETIADFLCKDLLIADLGEHRRSLRLNVQTQSSQSSAGLPEDLQRRLSRGFARISQSRLQLAHGAISEACGARLASQALATLLGSESGKESTSGSGRILELLEEERATKRQWVARLLESAQGSGLIQQVQNWGQESWRSLQRGHRSRSTHLNLLLQQGQRWLEQELLPQLQGRRQQIHAAELVRLRGLCARAVEEGGWGVRQVLGRIPEAATSLRRWGESFRRQAGGLVELQRELAGQIARQLAELSRAEGRSNWDGRRSLLIQHHLRKILEMHLGGADSPGLFLARLMQEAHHEAFLLCRDLSADLETAEPPGELVGELQILAQQLEGLIEKLERKTDLPDESPPNCYNLCTRHCVWEEIYPRYVGGELPAELARGLLREGGGLAACLTHEPFYHQLLLRARTYFAELSRDYGLLQLYPRYEKELPALLESAGRAARAVDPATTYHLVAMPALTAALGPLSKAQGERNSEKLQAQVVQLRPGLTHYFWMGHGEEIVFFCEAVGLSVAELLPLKVWREAYLHLYTQGEALHIDSLDQQFADLAGLHPQEMQAMRESQEAFWLASLLGVLHCEGRDWIWRQSHPTGPRVHPLGERHRLIARLTRAPRLRLQLLAESRNWLEGILQGQSLEPLVALAGSVAQHKRRLWQAEGGRLDLDFLAEIEQKICSSRLYEEHRESFGQLLRAQLPEEAVQPL
ncbi:MAG: tubulin-like doman-containing protein [Vulcanimicrobiota bacterium]